MKYHYVIIQDKADYFRVSWNDIFNIPDTEYYDCFPCGANRYITKLFQIHFSRKIRERIELPFKSLWNPFFYRSNNLNKPICFVFSSRYAFFIYNGLIDYLKKKYKGSKFVCFYQDIVSTHPDVNIDDVKKNFDLVISYDQNDAQQYDIQYHPTVYSYYELNSVNNVDECDVYFVGAAKNRLNKLVETYDLLTKKGLVCKFFITGVAQHDQICRDGISYITRMSYLDNIKYIQKANCILEVLQEGAIGYSLRLWEAITYRKYFITNNNQINDLKKNNLGIYSIKEASVENIRSQINKDQMYDSQWQELIHVDKFLLYIEKLLS